MINIDINNWTECCIDKVCFAKKIKTWTKKQFLRQLKRERSRSDRNNIKFSLIIFSVSSQSKRHFNSRDQIEQVLKRLRPADDIAWINRKKIAVLLPNTPPEGASKVAENIVNTIGADRADISFAYQIYQYPADECEYINVKEKYKIYPMSRLFKEQLPVWKRSIDILGSLLGLIALSPLLLLIALYVKMVSPGPVLFKQKRVGYLGKPFMCLKFRTMKVDSDENLHSNHVNSLMKKEAPLHKLDDIDPRIIPMGIIFRKSGLDELPQLINILKGEMSIVGPRPELFEIRKGYTQWCTKRFDVTPGLTGLWQVNGKNRTTYKEMMRLDIGYVRTRSLFVDIMIILKTFPAVWNQIKGTSPKIEQS